MDKQTYQAIWCKSELWYADYFCTCESFFDRDISTLSNNLSNWRFALSHPLKQTTNKMAVPDCGVSNRTYFRASRVWWCSPRGQTVPSFSHRATPLLILKTGEKRPRLLLRLSRTMKVRPTDINKTRRTRRFVFVFASGNGDSTAAATSLWVLSDVCVCVEQSCCCRW